MNTALQPKFYYRVISMDRERVKDYAIKSSLESTVQEVLDLLEADDGKPFEEKKAAAVNLLRKSKEAPLAEALVDFAVADTVGKTTKEKFWDAGTISCLNGGLILRKVEEADRDGYIGLQKAYNLMKSMLKEETYCDMVWREHQEPKALMFSIIKDGQYIGYCGIKNTSQEPWEIAIEILPDWTNQGIGRIAIDGMLDAVKARLGINQFRVRIDPGNHASQKMFEKLGAIPNGISEFLIHDRATLEKCEEDNLHLIDADTISLAGKFGVEPRKLLSHILEYSLPW